MSRFIRQVLWSCTAMLIAQLANSAVQPANAEDKRQTNITIARDTTRVTAPLTDDGYLDYPGAINQRLGESVTPETNANVLFWLAMGPHPKHATVTPEFFKLMEIPPPNEDGDYFVDFMRYLNLVANIKSDDPRLNEILEQQALCRTRPWTNKQYPQVAAWLRANEAPLALVVEGTRRPKYYAPLVVPHGKSVESNTLMGAPPAALEQYRSFAWALSSRAMLHVGEGRIDAAWQDLLACHRLARLVGRVRH